MRAALLLLLAAAPLPPPCPEGRLRVGAPPPEGTEAYCRLPGEGPEVRDGPYVAWYEDGTIHREFHYLAGKLHGPWREFYRGGRLAAEGGYRNDRKEGIWRHYGERGQLLEECGWQADLRHGRAALYWPDGKRRSEGRWCHGAQCGLWISWTAEGREQGRAAFEAMSDRP